MLNCLLKIIYAEAPIPHFLWMGQNLETGSWKELLGPWVHRCQWLSVGLWRTQCRWPSTNQGEHLRGDNLPRSWLPASRPENTLLSSSSLGTWSCGLSKLTHFTNLTLPLSFRPLCLCFQMWFLLDLQEQEHLEGGLRISYRFCKTTTPSHLYFCLVCTENSSWSYSWSLQSFHLLGIDPCFGLQIISVTYISHHVRTVSTDETSFFSKACRWDS